jgi:hypothetical protein
MMRTGFPRGHGLPDIDPSIALAQVARWSVADRLPPPVLVDDAPARSERNGRLVTIVARMFAQARLWRSKLETETA